MSKLPDQREVVNVTVETVREKLMYIDGAWVSGETGQFSEGFSPVTEQLVSKVPVAGLKDAGRAAQAARRAFDEGPWPHLTMRERSDVIRRWAKALRAREEEWLELITLEIGTARAGVGRNPFAGIRGAIGYIEDFADLALTFPLSVSLFSADASAMPDLAMGGAVARREPVGVALAITPYNAPTVVTPWKLGPALAMGNTVILKPSPYTPLQAALFVETLEEAGIPKGVINLVYEGPGVARELTESPEVDMISFTGSDAVGKLVMTQAAATFKRLVMELGGKSPNIIFEDADLSRATPNALQFLSNAGQGCSLQTRILVQESIHDEVVEMLVAALKKVKVGDPRDETVNMGPLISQAQRARVERYVASAIRDGGTIAFGGRRPPGLDRGWFYEPTLITGLDNSAEIAQDEVFGPVAVVIPFQDEDEAVRIANDSRYGLGGGVHSADVKRAWRVALKLRTGMVTINGGGAVARAPFGGVKHSGFGREHGHWGFEEYSQLKSITWPIR